VSPKASWYFDNTAAGLPAIDGESAKHRNLDTAGMDEDKVIGVRLDAGRQARETSYRFDEAAQAQR
jgi:hypothetical protein